MIKVLIVDDQELVSNAVAALIDLAADIEVIAQANSGFKCIEHISSGLQPDVILMDIRMPDMSGIETINKLRQSGNTCKILLLTTFDEPAPIKQGMALGASGCVLKSTTMEKLTEAIQTVYNGGTYLEQQLESSQQTIEHLTPREFTVLQALTRGKKNQEVAEELGISLGTVKIYTSAIFDKMDVRDRTQAVLKAKQIGLL